jgi:hypothetical protein
MMTDGEARAAIQAVLEKHPDLTCNGFERPDDEGFEQRRADIPIEAFKRSVAWLSHVPKIKRGGASSYRLKHVAERWSDSYIPNGAMIAAAVYMGFRIEPLPSHINVLIGVASARRWPLASSTKEDDWLRRRHRNKLMIEPPAFA